MTLPTKVPAKDYEVVADAVGWSPFLVRAVSLKETWRHEENPNDIRFESARWRKYRFASREARRFDRRWNSRDRAKRWNQFRAMDLVCQQDAMLNPRAGSAAILSHSFGWPQIMGFNHRFCGFEKPRDFLASIQTLEGQRMAMIAFIMESPSILRAGQKLDIETLAYHYNGPAFRKNRWAKDVQSFYINLKSKDARGSAYV